MTEPGQAQEGVRGMRQQVLMAMDVGEKEGQMVVIQRRVD